jgi:segregation and condensation protein A
METLDLDVATEFLLIAATLVELKARRLLPDLGDAELDEELLRFEARDLLLAVARVQDGQGRRGRRRRRAHGGRPQPARSAGPEEPYRSLVPDPLDRVTLGQLAAARPAPLAQGEAVRRHRPPRAVRASVAGAVVVLDRLRVGEAVPFAALVAGVAGASKPSCASSRCSSSTSRAWSSSTSSRRSARSR